MLLYLSLQSRKIIREMKERIKQVMRFSGPRMILCYPIDFMKYVLKKIRERMNCLILNK